MFLPSGLLSPGEARPSKLCVGPLDNFSEFCLLFVIGSVLLLQKYDGARLLLFDYSAFRLLLFDYSAFAFLTADGARTLVFMHRTIGRLPDLISAQLTSLNLLIS